MNIINYKALKLSNEIINGGNIKSKDFENLTSEDMYILMFMVCEKHGDILKEANEKFMKIISEYDKMVDRGFEREDILNNAIKGMLCLK